MTEIEKLYENAGFKKDLPINLADLDFSEEDCDELCLDNSCDECRYKTYPPFTAGKQLELIKFLLDKYCDIRIRKNLEGAYYIKSFNDISCFSEDFEETLANFMNTHLQDLTEQEQQQIKEILK